MEEAPSQDDRTEVLRESQCPCSLEEELEQEEALRESLRSRGKMFGRNRAH